MTQQASYVFTEQGETFAVVFEGDEITYAVDAPDPQPELLLDYIETLRTGEATSDPEVVRQLNHDLSFGGVAEIDHLGYVSV